MMFAVGRPLRSLMVLALLGCSVPRLALAQTECPRADLPAYAHNDYANAQPLREALALGYQGVEVDLYLMKGELRVGHDRRAAARGSTLASLYLEPLQALLAQCRSAPDLAPRLLLTIEIKEASRETYDSLAVTLARYPAVARAVRVVLVGWHPNDVVLDSAAVPVAHQLRVTSAQVPPRTAVRRHVALLTIDYGKTSGRWWVRAGTRQRWLDVMRDIKQAYPALLLRVHNVPTDSALYRALRLAGADLIGTKQLAASAAVLRADVPLTR